MPVVKTEAHELLSLTYQPFYMDGKLRMGFTAGFAFDLATGRPAEPTAAFAAAMGALAPGECLDMGVPKKEAEWLLAGRAYAPGGAPSRGTIVSVRVGESRRRFLVEGREPFVSAGLGWSSTWGSDAENPDGPRPGKGEKPPVTDESAPYGAPACMGPRGAWPCRMGRMGTYDGKWLREKWPGVPDDFDWGFYNLSQPPQRLPKGLRGGETVALVNLNKDLPSIETAVPRAEAVFSFVTKDGASRKAPQPDTLWLFPDAAVGLLLWHAAVECDDEAGAGIEEVNVSLNIDGEPAKAAADYAAPPEELPPVEPHARAETAGAEASAAVAADGAAAAAAEKLETHDAASGEAQASAEAENVSHAQAVSAAPSGESFAVSASELRADMRKEFEESLPGINAELAKAGLPPMTAEQAAETRERIDRLSERMAELSARAGAAKPPAFEESLKRAGVSDAQIESVRRALDILVPNIEDFKDKAAWKAASDAYAEKFGAAIGADAGVVSRMKKTLASLPVGESEAAPSRGTADCAAQLVKAGMEPAAAARFAAALEEEVPYDPRELLDYASRLEAAAGFPKDSVRGRIENIQKKMNELGVTMGGGAAPAAVPVAASAAEPAVSEKSAEAVENTAEAVRGAAEAPLSRESAALLIASGGSLAGAKLDGLDLSGMDLSGQELAGTSFIKSKLDGASFNGASLAGAVLAGASLKGASFTGADLKGAVLSSAAAEDADFTEALLEGADISGAALAGASLYNTDARGLRAQGAALSRARVAFSDVSASDFSGADLRGVDFHESKADGSNFAGAALGGSTFCRGSSARECSFAGAGLTEANWTECDLTGSDFTGAEAGGASFTDCLLSSSRWTGASARGGDFSRSRLDGASMRGIDLFRGSLREARLHGADLSKSNLFGADLCRIFTDGATDMSGADCGQTVVEARKGR
ncbi:DUF2169 domain-containing protein [Cloacibacillus sp. An23]|uniref:pentapeptide repeat-containing protein n=1 Tax=Cloacibacillus sp. An23 TaxID=1965591 RepID=UPI000B38D153|nr:DUF2169 domain-containing protein [Cloacibacillus sp. An23]OUO93847.1 hypothetical protein B5F39_06610 [Cloacibacillus sp. An23]